MHSSYPQCQMGYPQGYLHIFRAFLAFSTTLSTLSTIISALLLITYTNSVLNNNFSFFSTLYGYLFINKQEIQAINTIFLLSIISNLNREIVTAFSDIKLEV